MNSRVTVVEATGKKRGPRDLLALMARGYVMGAADVIPGVSGGTMAFILGIYEELIESIRAVGRPEFLRPLLARDLRGALAQINLPFLAAVGSGILLAVVTLAGLLEHLLMTYPSQVLGFFFGLVLASVFAVGRRIERWSPRLYAAAAIAALVAWVVVGLVPVQTPESLWFYFLSGALAICAMILPGISGAFILLLLGKYEAVLGAVVDRDLLTIAVVGAGAVGGLLLFSQILGWLFHRYHDLVVAALTGLILGSLRKIWPWKVVTETMTDRHGELVPLVERNILPPDLGPESGLIVLLFVLGLVAVLVLNRVGAVRSTAH